MKLLFLSALTFLTLHGNVSAETVRPANYSRGNLGSPVLMDQAAAPLHAIPVMEADALAEKVPGEIQYGLKAESTLGASDVELSAPQYYLGDKIAPPEGSIDWEAIHQNLSEFSYHFLIDVETQSVYAVAGGSATFVWPMKDGTQTETIYQIAYSCQGRPKRVFWTNHPHVGPAVSLNNSFVKLHGDPKLINVKKKITHYPNSDIVISEEVLHGIYIDETSNAINVIQGDRQTYGDLLGQFVVAYYSSGSYGDLLGLEVVEVSAPEPVMLTGFVGVAVKPNGGGFPIEDLVPYPETIIATDNRGDYYYQHMTDTPNHPQNRQVYPLRPTDSANMRLQVWWKEADKFDTLWPFELSVYECEWSNKPLTQVVSGSDGSALPLMIGNNSQYTASYEKYFSDNIRTLDLNSTDQTVTVTLKDPSKIGQWTLRLTVGEDIYFIPVVAIANTNTDVFSNEAAEWLVGSEIVPRGGEVSGVTTVSLTEVDASLAGYIYEATSARLWNASLYKKPSASASVETNEALPSAIFPVRAIKASSESPVEVWWRGAYQQAGMPSAITSPVLVQRYAPRWPRQHEAPAIVLASGLGSGGYSLTQSGSAMGLATASAMLPLPSRKLFGNGGTVAFWIKPGGSGDVLTLGSPETLNLSLVFSEGRLQVTLSNLANGSETFLGEVALTQGEWHFLAFTMDARETRSRCFKVFLNGVCCVSYALEGMAAVDGEALLQLASGVFGSTRQRAAVGTVLDEISFWRTPLTESELADLQYRHPVLADKDLILATTFEERNDLQPLATAEAQRTVTDVVTQTTLLGHDLFVAAPGAPQKRSAIITSDTEPILYRQNNPKEIGYNPNEEHAFIRSGNGGYTLWAYRCDLNTDETSAPGVLVTYTQNGKAKMKWVGVQATSAFYPAFRGTCTAGHLLPGPHPFDLMQEPWLEAIAWENGDAETSPVYRDRKKQLWARAAGDLDIYMYYRNDPSFDTPNRTLADNAPIEWLPTGAYTDWNGNAVDAWHWTITWPAEVPTLKIGQTLTKPVNGLPEVWGAKSLALLYKDADVVLFDPTIVRTTGLTEQQSADMKITSTTDLINALGLVPGQEGVNYQGGRYTFDGAPASVADRFYIDASADIKNCIRLLGKLDERRAGTDMLYLNILNAEERNELAAMLFPEEDSERRRLWQAIITGSDATGKLFAGYAVEPSLTEVTNTNGQLEWQTTYEAVDHYALAAKGLTSEQSGYVTLLENDDPNTDRVDEGDPISMHIIKVVPELYTGSLLVREDPTNLLSQQLSVLYTEGFAGDASNYTFEWKWAEPTASGRVPKEYENGYLLHAREDGLTRFLIGTQGDTLENMVNRYYAMRYRPKTGSDEHAMFKALIQKRDGDENISDDDPRLWSAWCGPTLAEGWVQRVLNNVTPFTQRMTDLYTNAAETAVSMIQQAGAPYTGDVALNQENLKAVGLIQLYATLLNKAESMSINQGVGSGAVNSQLLLAATRLADLYCVLGDEAYADALNPTIGFGSEFARVDDANLGIDYGSLSSGLFCFDNQVQSLLDEELALLRGRSAEDAPSKQAGPWYNRLMWNFTKGINAGEVAYAVNYNISGSDTGTLDEETAAKLYPQGHGDAYGHYLSAVKAYYRLLRNPNFSWGTPGMGEMLMADAVVNVDYYEESRFGELSGALSKTAAAVMERTAQKAWRDNGGMPGAGYLDENKNRAFGYGEWGTRAALGAFYGWAVGNSLLPAGPQEDAFWQFHAIVPEDSESAVPPLLHISLPESCSTAVPMDPTNIGYNTALEPFTFELQVEVPESQRFVSPESPELPLITLATHEGEGIFQILRRTSDAMLIAVYGETVSELGKLPVGERCLLALRRELVSEPVGDGTLQTDNALTVTLLRADGSPQWSVDLDEPLGTMPHFAFTGGEVFLGNGTEAIFHEVRWWQGVARTNERLHAARQKLTMDDPALRFSLHTYTNSVADILYDTVNRMECHTFNGDWQEILSNGLSIDFRDDGLLRINRETADELNELPQTLTDITAAFDRLDIGASPMGLAENAVPFDISPIGLEDGTQTHFEQILGRAEIALKNAASVLDHVQTLGCRLRQIQEAQVAYEEQLAMKELLLEGELIAIYGTPYSGDIGPGKLYNQDYDGPDYYHYMYTDLSVYGLSTVPSTDSQTVEKSYAVTEEDYKTILYPKDSLNYKPSEEKLTLSYDLTADGLIAKPDDITGSRRIKGRIQQAYADVLEAYVAYKNSLEAVAAQEQLIVEVVKELQTVYKSAKDHYLASAILKSITNAATTTTSIVAAATGALDVSYQITNTIATATKEAGTWVVVGVANGSNAPATISNSIANGVVVPSAISSKVANESFERYVNIQEALIEFIQSEVDIFETEAALRDVLFNYRMQIRDITNTYCTLVQDLQLNAATLQAQLLAVSEALSDAEGYYDERQLIRKQAVDGIARMRYNDMFFRQMQNEALARYEKAFALAQQYTYLAAQAYSYETCQLTAGPGGLDFRGEIIAARAIGQLTEDGKPMLAGAYGDAGLSDILARMKADYLVLKPRLGINNPKQEQTWFSLRRECFRLENDAEGDEAWRAKLKEYVVADLHANEAFMRYCHPLASSVDPVQPEPGLVIPFETTIDFARNFFGKELMGGDSAFSPTDFATRIAGAGISFVGYNKPAEGVSGQPPLATTPQVYLIPAGKDYFRAPGDADTILRYSVVDQTIPLPYNIGRTELNDPDWQPIYDGLTGGVDLGSRLRKYGSFRASVDGGNEEAGSTRLIGRSVWNSRWYLIIPFGSMHNDRETAMRAFIDGTSDYPGVSDIRLGLRTYSHEGN